MFRDIIPRRFRRRHGKTTTATDFDWYDDELPVDKPPIRQAEVVETPEGVYLYSRKPAPARLHGVSVDREPSPTGGHITRVTPDPLDAVNEAYLRQDLGFPLALPRTEAAAGHGLSLAQLDEVEDWYRARLQPTPSWVQDRRAEHLAQRINAHLTQGDLDAALARARQTGADLDAVHDAFEDRLSALDERIVTSVRGVVDPTAQPRKDRDLLERIGETLGEHVHTWDQEDSVGRPGWRCACAAVKCDLPRCIRPRHDGPPHHMRS